MSWSDPGVGDDGKKSDHHEHIYDETYSGASAPFLNGSTWVKTVTYNLKCSCGATNGIVTKNENA